MVLELHVVAEQHGSDVCVAPHLVGAPAACSSWRTILLGSALPKQGCTRNHGCCRAQSLHTATGLCILDTRGVQSKQTMCLMAVTVSQDMHSFQTCL